MGEASECWNKEKDLRTPKVIVEGYFVMMNDDMFLDAIASLGLTYERHERDHHFSKSEVY